MTGQRSIAFAAGTEGAGFLDIPVGAGPASMGSAYTAIASNAYAPTWNPAGLGNLDSAQVAGTHLDYLDSLHYEYVSGVLPLAGTNQGVGAAVQYLGSGDIDGRDAQGLATGSFSTTFAAYSLAYGTALNNRLSLGATAKAITESISNTSGRAYAVDAGTLYHASDQWDIAATVDNVGPSIRLVQESDPLPFAAHAGTVYTLAPSIRLALEGVYRKEGPASAQLGVEWKYGDLLALRAGYNSSHVKGLSAATGLSGGFGLSFFGQEFSYAYVPYGNLGDSHYFSLIFRFAATPSSRPTLQPDSNATESKPLKKVNSTAKERDNYDSIVDQLSDSEKKALRQPPPQTQPVDMPEGSQ